MILALAAAVLAVGGCHKWFRHHRSPDVASAAAADPVAAAQAAAPRTDSGQAQAFLTGLYTHYQSSKNDTFDMFGANKTEVFDPDTLALLAEDSKVLKGELGDVDGDLLCDCQDFVSLKSQVAVQSATPTEAQASAEVQDVGMPGMSPKHILFKLTKTNGVWRIHDVKADSQDWLRASLTQEIKSLKGAAPLISDPDKAP
jgi:hypothetical protein